MSRRNPLPRAYDTPAGPVRVVRARHIDQDDANPGGDSALGEWLVRSRTIRVLDTLTPDAAWLVFYHERVHQVLSDCGISLKLEEAGEEDLCNAIAAAWLYADRARPIVTK